MSSSPATPPLQPAAGQVGHGVTTGRFRFAAGGTAVVGHRGAPRRARENSLEAFRAAAAEGATWVELDARRTADGAVAVWHDATGPDGAPIVERSAAQLTALGIHTLDEVLAGLPDGLGVDVELKNLPGEPDFDEAQVLAELVAGTVRPHLGTRPLLATSFNPLATTALRAALPELALGLLTVPGLGVGAGVALAAEFGCVVLCPHESAPDLEDAGALHEAAAAGLATMVWTLDDPARAVRLAALGVDALCTNEPGRIAAALGHGLEA